MTSTGTESRRKVYKKTLNLPKTSFPMRANLAQNEPLSQRRWRQERLYERVLEARADGEPFVFHDGPPYANGSIHAGHLLNKVLKDIVVRSRNLAGYRCPFVPGWDCHGLPIEHRVMGQLIESGKAERLEALAEDARRVAIRRECSRYAARYKKLQATQLERLLTLADYEQPYLTMTPDYEAAVLEVFAELVQAGIVYRALKPVHWSIANRTALAEAELEYIDREDPSVTVRFAAFEPPSVRRAFGLADGGSASFLIWTTTPWTLPANLLIAVHPRLRYSLVELDDGAVIIASELVSRVLEAAGRQGRVLGEATGEALVGLEYRHPLVDRRGRVVGADYVTLDEGTGLVHTAPGHGREDFETGEREGVEAYCPVGGDGRFDDSVPDWLRGELVWEANPEIARRLQGSGHLFDEARTLHSYPHDWRSKTPVIFRCTEQWFVAVDRPAAADGRSLRELAVGAAEETIRFVPEWGRNRLRGMLESRPDWCISRQRAWGLPIPAFRLPDGGTFLTPASVRAVARLIEREGSDAWFNRRPSELLADYAPADDPDAPKGLEVASLEKMHDIFDVWFESGSSWHAVLRRRGLGFPADLYLEGSDQHRGWFQLSLLTAVGATGGSPFRGLLTHGFTVDKAGRKMSKSLGNTVEVEDLLRRFGADVCRWWISSLSFETDIKADVEFFEVAGESYRKVRNTLRFLLSNLSDYPAGEAEAAPPPASLDAFALARAAELRGQVLAAFEAYQFRRAHLLLYDFCNDTLSALYLQAIKDRLYCDRPDAPRRRAAQAAMWKITDLLATLLAPILPHTADEVGRTLRGEGYSVHLQTFAPLEAAADPSWTHVLEVREQVLKALEEVKASGLENPLDAGVVLPDPDRALGPFEAELADLFGVSRVRLAPDGALQIVDLREEPRCERSWKRDGTVKQRRDGGWLSDRDAAAVGVV